jgi:hypothetical protein
MHDCYPDRSCDMSVDQSSAKACERGPQILAVAFGWSTARAQGYVEGEDCRRRGGKPTPYRLVGIDEYALGFRAGYFVRGPPL